MQKKNSSKHLATASQVYDSASDADNITYQALKQRTDGESDSDDEGYESDVYQDGQDDIILSESDGGESQMSESQENTKEEND